VAELGERIIQISQTKRGELFGVRDPCAHRDALIDWIVASRSAGRDAGYTLGQIPTVKSGLRRAFLDTSPRVSDSLLRLERAPELFAKSGRLAGSSGRSGHDSL